MKITKAELIEELDRDHPSEVDPRRVARILSRLDVKEGVCNRICPEVDGGGDRSLPEAFDSTHLIQRIAALQAYERGATNDMLIEERWGDFDLEVAARTESSPGGKLSYLCLIKEGFEVGEEGDITDEEGEVVDSMDLDHPSHIFFSGSSAVEFLDRNSWGEYFEVVPVKMRFTELVKLR